MPISQNTPLAILGGGGKAGLPLVRAALSAGHYVRVLLRHPEQFPIAHERLTVVSGDARDEAALRSLLTGCHALLSALGHPKGEPTPIMAHFTLLLLPLLEELNVRRYVALTSLYDTDQPQTDADTRQAAEYMVQHFPTMMADRAEELRLLQRSALDWTLIRAPFLVPGDRARSGVPAGASTGNSLSRELGIAVSLMHRPGPTITTGDLAQFILAQLTDATYHRQAPFVANG